MRHLTWEIKRGGAMPVYEYQCTERGERFEVWQLFGEDGSSLGLAEKQP
jgi:predicted nucleic acid-binding Zn ribbon protein